MHELLILANVSMIYANVSVYLSFSLLFTIVFVDMEVVITNHNLSTRTLLSNFVWVEKYGPIFKNVRYSLHFYLEDLALMQLCGKTATIGLPRTIDIDSSLYSFLCNF